MSAALRALSLRELLGHVLSFLWMDPQDCLSCALVCRVWLSPSLDLLWSDVNNAAKRFSQLSPMRRINIHDDLLESGQEAWEFIHTPTAEDWHRFANRIACRVQTFTYEPTGFVPGRQFCSQLSKSAWLNLQNSPMPPVLANVKELHDMDFDALEYEIHGLVKMDRVPGLINELAHEAPNLEFLEIYIGLEDSLDYVLSPTSIHMIGMDLFQLRHLRHAGLPGAIFTFTMLVSLSLLPQLATLKTTDIFSHIQHDNSPRPSFDTDAFEALEWLDFNPTFSDALWFFRHPGRPRRLTSLVLKNPSDYPIPSRNKDWEELFEAISEALPLLNHICINYHETRAPAEFFDADILRFSSLMGICQLTSLRQFYFYYPYAFEFTCDQLRSLAISCSQLETLNITWPIVSSAVFTPQLTPEDLLILAQHCPKLQDLWIPFNLQAPQGAESLILGLGLRRSVDLSLGNAELPLSRDWEQMAVRLARIFPKGCKLSDGQLNVRELMEEDSDSDDAADTLNDMLQEIYDAKRSSQVRLLSLA